MRVGNDVSYASLSDQREASKIVKVYDVVPPGATVISKVDAGRCHRNFVETSPNEHLVIMDLKLAAYALGANGISNVVVREESALTKNCWYMVDGEALAISIPEK